MLKLSETTQSFAMDNLLIISLIYAGIPLLVYFAIGTLIYSKGPAYKFYAIIFFVSVPTLILVISLFHFAITYYTGGFAVPGKPGYPVYKFLVLKNIIPEQLASEKKTTQYDTGEYIGQLKDGKRHGQGTYLFANFETVLVFKNFS